MRWHETPAATALGVRYPIVQAPMAGVTTPALAAAVSNAGGLGSLGAAWLPPDELRAAIRAVRDLTDRPFMVNLFAWPEPVEPDAGTVASMRASLRSTREALGADDPEPSAPDVRAHLAAQLEVVLEERVPVFSFIFGIPDFAAIRDAGAVVVGTATTVAEAQALEAAGVDLVVAQGWEGGGHRGTFDRPLDEVDVATMPLVPQVVDAVSIPVLAGGGIMDGRGVAAALALGAGGAWLGTAFIAAPESLASDAYRAALARTSVEETVVTRAFSGRNARMLRSALVDRIERSGLEPAPFPLQLSLTRPLQVAAAAKGATESMFLLAGQGAALARELPAGELVGLLVAETSAAIARLDTPPR
ncbi:MAG: nitronate monooxygenase [Actinomycetota bacterium]|nr:nitronate monooxygenase [Actinomycetota bacterium]